MPHDPHFVCTPRRRRPYWVWPVFAGYLLVLAGGLACPWFLASFWNLDSAGGAWTVGLTGLWLLLLAGLMFVPVRIACRRSLSRRAIWIPLIFSGFMAGILAFAAGLALWEVFQISFPPWPLLLGALGIWALWTGLFFMATRVRGRMSIAQSLHRWLIAGSLAELLIAGASDVYVRRRGACCAGMDTLPAICLGVSVLALALGPAAVLLLIKRWCDIHPLPDNEHGFEVTLAPPAPAPPQPTPSIPCSAPTSPLPAVGPSQTQPIS